MVLGDPSRQLRTFVAVMVRPMPTLLAVLNELRQLGPAVRPVAPDNLHVTLRFLGPVGSDRLEALSDALHQAAVSEEPFDVQVVGMGGFPDLNRPSILWAGLEPQAALQRIVERLALTLQPLGFSPEDRPWQGHLTLARVKRRPPRQLADIYRRHGGEGFGSSRVKELDLMASDLTPNGPVYTVLHSATLGGSRP